MQPVHPWWQVLARPGLLFPGVLRRGGAGALLSRTFFRGGGTWGGRTWGGLAAGAAGGVQVGAGHGQDAVTELSAGFSRRRRLRQGGRHLAVARQGPGALRAAAGVLQVELLVGGLERIERVPGGQLLEGVMPGCAVAHGVPPSPGLATEARRTCSRRMAANMRVFTVPSGVPVSWAISRWV